MSKFILKPITETSWILSSNSERIGIVTKNETGVNILGNIEKKKFEKFDDLKSYLGNVTILEPEEPKEEKVEGDINGYPIKHPTWYNIMTEPVPSYTKTKNNSVRYAAGFYGIKSSDKWTSSFCPKLTTLSENEFIGPFTTHLEMRNAISQKNQQNEI